jgi:site-specific recombinase XerD
MAGLSRWLEGVRLELDALTTARAAEFLSAHRADGHRFPKSAEGLGPLLGYLRGVGVVPQASTAVRTPVEELLARFGVYLAGERGLAAGTIIGYQHAGALLFAALDAVGRDLEGLTSAVVQEFLLAECADRSVFASKNLVKGLRSLLRFLHVEGITAVSLAGGVPTVSGWSGTSVPRGIDARSVQRLLASCDRRTVKGGRDFAVLTLLCRLGVRAGEVTALTLTDIDWRAGEVVVHGKGNRLERLPLPVDVGEALAAYVRRGRPRSDVPQLFLRVLAPQRGLTIGGINEIVHSACDRAGLPSVGTHRLRHTVASELLRSGAGLAEIGQLLRHRSIATTSVYAKVHTDALRQLARPWPGGAA